MSDIVFKITRKSITAWELTGSSTSPRVRELATFNPDGGLFTETNMPKTEWFLESLADDDRKRSNATVFVADMDLYIRKVSFPFKEIDKGRMAAPSVLSPILPFAGEFAFDLLPLEAGGDMAEYIALCLKKTDLDRIMGLFDKAAIEVRRVIPALLLSLPEVWGDKEGDGASGYIDDRIGCISRAGWEGNGGIRLVQPGIIKDEIDRDISRLLNLSGEKVAKAKGLKVIEDIGEEHIQEFLKVEKISDFNLFVLEAIHVRDTESARLKKLMILSTSIIFLFSIIMGIEGTRYYTRKRADIVRTEMSEKFGKVMKGATMVDPVAQVKAKIDTLEDEVALFPEGRSPLTSLLFSLSSGIKSRDRIKVSEIDYARGKMTLSGEASGQEGLSRVKERITKEYGSNVEIIETGPSAVEGRIKFKISVYRGTL